jgi:hypothetical protein
MICLGGLFILLTPEALLCVCASLLCSGCKFAQSWSSAVAAAAAASLNDSHSGGDESLSHAALPCSCLAAVAEPNKVVALLAISRPVYMEVIMAATMTAACSSRCSGCLL